MNESERLLLVLVLAVEHMRRLQKGLSTSSTAYDAARCLDAEREVDQQVTLLLLPARRTTSPATEGGAK